MEYSTSDNPRVFEGVKCSSFEVPENPENSARKVYVVGGSVAKKKHVFKGGNRSSFQVPKNPRNFTGKLHVAGGTVYNTLNQFTDAGFLRRVMVHNEYRLFDTNTEHHYHFYDAADDRLIDIPSDDVVLSRLPQAPANHAITGVDVIIHVSKK